MTFLLRVKLPDVPGSLGRVASAIGEAGGDIGAIEIVEHRDDGYAVDDVLLDLVPGTMPDSIVSACSGLDGVEVVWISRYAAGGNLFLDLEAVEQLTAEPAAALDALVDLAPFVFRADWAMRLCRTERGVVHVHTTSAAPEPADGAPDAWFPLTRPARLDVPEGWERWTSTVVAGAPLSGPNDIVLFGRRGGPDVLDSELARLGHLAALAHSIAARG